MGRDAYRPKLTREEMERRRLLAAEDLRSGKRQAEVARKYGVDPSSVSRWNKALKRKGKRALHRKKPRGRAPALGAKQRHEVGRILLRGAQEYGFEADIWTMPRLASVVKKELGVTLDESNLRKTLVKMGYSWQRPERRARERDEKAIKAWVQTEWPQIAKKGRNPET